MEKMTIVKQYEAIIEKAKGVLSPAEIEFLEKRAELHAKKNASRKPTKAQEENEAIKAEILAFMKKDEKYTVTQIQKAMGLESNQKTSALVRQLKRDGIVTRTEIKGVAYFSLA